MKEKDKGKERERDKEGGRRRGGEVGKSHTAVNEPPPTPAERGADAEQRTARTYVRTYVSYVTCVRT